MKVLNLCLPLLVVMAAVALAGCTTRSTKAASNDGDPPAAARDAVFITSRTDPRSHCQAYTDVYLQNRSARSISVEVKRSDQADKQTSISTYRIDPTPATPRWEPWTGGPRNPELLIGCRFDGAKVNTFTITRADYLR